MCVPVQGVGEEGLHLGAAVLSRRQADGVDHHQVHPSTRGAGAEVGGVDAAGKPIPTLVPQRIGWGHRWGVVGHHGGRVRLRAAGDGPRCSTALAVPARRLPGGGAVRIAGIASWGVSSLPGRARQALEAVGVRVCCGGPGATTRPRQARSRVTATTSCRASQHDFHHETRACIGQQQQTRTDVQHPCRFAATPTQLPSGQQQSGKGQPGQD